jgi:elongation factor P
MTVVIEMYEETPIGVSLPDQVILTIEVTEPVVKGQTAANSFKPATCDNGVRITVPPFVGVGERVIVQTSDRTYLKRAD